MNTHTTLEDRLVRLERSSGRWRATALGLIGLGLAAALTGAGGEHADPTLPPKAMIAVRQGGFAVVEDGVGSWDVIYEAGIGVYKKVNPQR